MSIVWRYSPLVLIAFLLISVKIVPQELSHATISDRNMPDTVQGTANTVHDDGEHNRTPSVEKRDIINARRRAAYK